MSDQPQEVKKEWVRVEKRVLNNAIQIIGELPTGPIPFKTVAQVVGELQHAHESAVISAPVLSAAV